MFVTAILLFSNLLLDNFIDKQSIHIIIRL